MNHSMSLFVYESLIHLTKFQKHVKHIGKMMTILFSEKILKFNHFLKGSVLI